MKRSSLQTWLIQAAAVALVLQAIDSAHGQANGRVAGRVVAWGDNSTVPDGLDDVVAIAGGISHSLALKKDGIVIAWGAGTIDFGQSTVPHGLADIVAIAAGNFHNLALKQDGTVVAWGVWRGNEVDYPAIVPPGLNGVAAVAAGFNHSLALRNDGTVFAWGGDNRFGECPISSMSSQPRFLKVTASTACGAHERRHDEPQIPKYEMRTTLSGGSRF